MRNFIGDQYEQPQDYQMQQPQQGQSQQYNPQQDPHSLGNVFQPLGQSHLGLAGLLLASGVPYKDALVQASAMHAQQETANAERQKVQNQGNEQQQKQRQMQLKQRALQAIQENQDKPEIVQKLLYSGAFEPTEIEHLNKQLNFVNPAETEFNKQKTRFELKQEERDNIRKEKFIETNNEKVNNVLERLDSLGALEENAAKFHQGAGSDVAHFVNKYQPFFGEEATAAYENFNSTAKNLVLETTAKQKGVQSDLDVKNIMATVPSTGNSAEGNKQIIDKLKKMSQRQLEYFEKGNAWVEAGGDIKEFEKKWKKYVYDNPLFGKETAGSRKKTNNRQPINELDEIEAILARRGYNG